MMAKYEAHMVHYKGSDLTRSELKLGEGEKEIIPLFHDESCLHANDQTSTAWLAFSISLVEILLKTQ